jgi:tetratricopeptide (TPR) repeat protein
MRDVGRVRLGVALVIAGAAIVGAQLLMSRRAASLSAGLGALAGGQLPAAADAFERASTEGTLIDRALHNLGVARARQRQSRDATAAFARAADVASSAAIGAASHYNRGVVLAEQGALPQSLAAFAQALRVSPTHEDARINYAIVRARLARARARNAADPATREQQERERQIAQAPDQAFGFPTRRNTRPVRPATDW